MLSPAPLFQTAEHLASLLILLSMFICVYAWKQPEIFSAYIFSPAKFKKGNFSPYFISTFLHAHWQHFFLNTLALFAVSAGLEWETKQWCFILCVAWFGSNLLAYHLQAENINYKVFGLQSIVTALLFAALANNPASYLLWWENVEFPLVILVIFYVLFHLFGFRDRTWGHESLVSGGLIGLFLTVGFYPQTLQDNTWEIFGLFTFLALLLGMLVTNAGIMVARKPEANQHAWYDCEDLTDDEILDRILEKISKVGYHDLLPEEKAKLEELSRKITVK